MIRTATILLFFAYLTGLCAASPTGAPNSDETIRSAVKIIELPVYEVEYFLERGQGAFA